MTSPSMVHRAGDTLVVRSVVSGNALYQHNGDEDKSGFLSAPDEDDADEVINDTEEDLPQCKIKRNYTCTECSYYSQNPRSFLYHLKDVHKQKIKIYECPSCLYASKHSQKLQRHVHMVHVVGKMKSKKKKTKKIEVVIAKNSQETAASVASSQQPGPGSEKSSREDAAAKEPPAPPVVKAAVREKPKTAPTKPGQEFRCSQCDWSSSSQTLLARHESAHLKKKFYRCGKCNYVTHMKARYTKHVKYHSMPMIKCDLCDFRTPYKWNLDRHYKNHTGDGAFRCSQCNFTADIKQSLTVHEMNHHVPPVGHGTPGRRRNKVGASDSTALEENIDREEMELLRMEREDALEEVSSLEPTVATTTVNDSNNSDRTVDNAISRDVSASNISTVSSNKSHSAANMSNTRRTPKIKMTIKKLKNLSTQEQNERHNFRTDFIHPDDIIHHKNGNVYIKNLKCKVCNYKAAWEGEMARHESKAHGINKGASAKSQPSSSPGKKVPRPIPNLIPIQNKCAPPSPPGSGAGVPILRIPTVRGRAPTSVLKTQQLATEPAESKMSDRVLNEICAKSCPTSSLKDFASLIGDEDAFRTIEEDKISNSEKEGSDEIETKLLEDVNISDSSIKPKSPPSFSNTTFKKKNASFFDKLKEKLATTEACNLVCTYCGHESKCLSELVRHQKLHTEKTRNRTDQADAGNCVSGLVITSGAELSSTRCQHCRQRCKTSADLVIHLQSCAEANKTLNSVMPLSHELSEPNEPEEKGKGLLHTGAPDDDEEEDDDDDDDEEEEEEEEESHMEGCQEPHPMENKVFVWNNLPQQLEEETQQLTNASTHDEDSRGTSVRSKSPISDGSLVGIETAPGYGAVTSKLSAESPQTVGELDVKTSLSVKKVFKCPHCTFWASTASRFHVHIVGHLNKKPFECSLCAYRSNWRWDITKHIRLKSARDAGHERARVLMTDETGRRNYSKYNKYLTLMRVHEPTAESSGSGRRTKGIDNGTHGRAVQTSVGLVQQLPALPRLTRAPTPRPLAAAPIPGVPLRPPPPLRAAHRLILPGPPPLHPKAMKRPAVDQLRDEEESPPKRPIIEGKKTLWKCKKCSFRDASRTLVLAHVKEHYQQRLQFIGSDFGERHCRLKHSGDVRVLIGAKQDAALDKQDDSPQEPDLPENSPMELQEGQTTACDKCPYTGESAGDVANHKEQHVAKPGAIFKCYFCPYYVFTKRELLDHMKVHGVREPEDIISKAVQEKLSQKNVQEPTAQADVKEVTRQYHNQDISPTKRYKCVGCPYVSNSKSQFLYHKQFHRPRGAPFKCGLCSYNVSRRHLLHQHLRVHGILVPPQKASLNKREDEVSDGIEEVPPPIQGQTLDTRRLADIPLVWVSRGPKFSKMFKCRFCPHVNVRKANIQEHEKMHRARVKNSGDTSQPNSSPAPQPQQHHCPDCNYICNNAGVLSSHAKVHQGLYGQVHCLVDTSRSDEAQLQDLTATLGDTAQPDEPQPTEEDQKDAAMLLASVEKEGSPKSEEESRVLYFCSNCPARFLFEKELNIHTRFHEIRLVHRCESCSYTARQRPHLLAHLKVHTDEYQEKTNALVGMYQTSSQHPRPRTAVIVEGPGVTGPVWVVISLGPTEDDAPTPVQPSPTKQVPKYSCHLCPAKFIKSVALQYHLTLHGGEGPHKCRSCDYAVKTYGNLVKHEMIHENPPSPAEKRSKTKSPPDIVPLSGTDLFQQRVQAQKQEADPIQSPSGSVGQRNSYDYAPLHVDPQFGILMHGNPDFIYPTYIKNGRMKEKRYKCHKCPSAFEKREQYKVHLSLHGSKQKYKCEKCDYSVKYYANYIQHVRKHQNNEQAQAARKEENTLKDEGIRDEEGLELEEPSPQEEDMAPVGPRAVKTIGGSPVKNLGSIQLSMADRQTLMLLQQRRASSANSAREDEPPRKLFSCPHCPYANHRRDGVESHTKRHMAVSGIQGTYTCQHCDYTVPQLHFLREHNKVHFNPHKRLQPEAYMKCEKIELWVGEEGKENITDSSIDKAEADELSGKRLLFQDLGCGLNTEERFYPKIGTELLNKHELGRIYVDINTGEPVIGKTEELPMDDKDEAGPSGEDNEIPDTEEMDVDQHSVSETDLDYSNHNREILSKIMIDELPTAVSENVEIQSGVEGIIEDSDSEDSESSSSSSNSQKSDTSSDSDSDVMENENSQDVNPVMNDAVTGVSSGTED